MTYTNVFECPIIATTIEAENLFLESPYILSKEPYHFNPHIETEDPYKFNFEVDYQIDLVAAIIASDKAFSNSSHIEFIPKPKHNYYLPRSKIKYKNYYIHEYPTLKLGKIANRYELWAFFPNAAEKRQKSSKLKKATIDMRFVEDFTKKFYCEAVRNISIIIQRYDIPYYPANDILFGEWYNGLKAGEAYPVSSIFMNAYFKVLQENKLDLHYPILYIQWPGGKQKIINGQATLEKLIQQHFMEVDPNYCFNGMILDLRAAIYCSKEQSNINYSVMWNPDKIASILKQSTNDDINFWNTSFNKEFDGSVDDSTAEIEEDSDIPRLSKPKVREYNCYGTKVWRDVFGKNLFFN